MEVSGDPGWNKSKSTVGLSARQWQCACLLFGASACSPCPDSIPVQHKSSAAVSTWHSMRTHAHKAMAPGTRTIQRGKRARVRANLRRIAKKEGLEIGLSSCGWISDMRGCAAPVPRGRLTSSGSPFKREPTIRCRSIHHPPARNPTRNPNNEDHETRWTGTHQN